jgi:methanethiol S-methyltransferase
VLAGSLALALLCWQWRPFGGTLWRLAAPGADVLLAVQGIGWLLALGSTFLISHTDLFGLRQAWTRAGWEACRCRTGSRPPARSSPIRRAAC